MSNLSNLNHKKPYDTKTQAPHYFSVSNWHSYRYITYNVLFVNQCAERILYLQLVFMVSIRDGLIQLGFCRTMYTENKQNSIEGVYDGIYNNVFVSLEVFTNGYIARVENNSEHRLLSESQEDIKISSLRQDADLPILELSTASSLLEAPLKKGDIILNTAGETRSIRSEVLTMHDIIHSLEKLTTNLQIKEQSPPDKTNSHH